LVRKASLTRIPELELDLIQTQMVQKQMLRVEVFARAFRASQNAKRTEVCLTPIKIRLPQWLASYLWARFRNLFKSYEKSETTSGMQFLAILFGTFG
jgi:hypothetical protein